MSLYTRKGTARWKSISIYNLHGVSKITGKNLLDGGGFESMRNLEIGVAKRLRKK